MGMPTITTGVFVLMEVDDPAAIERGLGVVVVNEIRQHPAHGGRVLSENADIIPREEIENWESGLREFAASLPKEVES